MRTPLLALGATRGGLRLRTARAVSPPGVVIATAALAVLLSLACKPGSDPSAGPENATPPPDEDPALEDASGGAAEEAEEGASEENSAGSASPAEEEATSESRVPLVDEDHEQYAQVEGTNFENGCDSDADCHAGGCSSEVCSAEAGVNSACVMPSGGWASEGGSCGCVEGTCTWYTVGDEDPEQDSEGSAGDGDGDDDSAGERDDEGSDAALPGQGENCDEGECADPLTCVRYHGVAGSQGPEFSSCEIPCPRGKADCPDGQTCVTIADGPGRVCRAR